MKSTVHKYDNVILGSTIEALMYAYITGYPVFFAGSRCPKDFEHFEPAFTFPNMPHLLQTKNTTKGIIEQGINKEKLWSNLMFYLSLAGQIPITEEASSFRIDDGSFRIVLSERYMINVEPKTIHLFDDLNVTGLPLSKQVGVYTVYDWLIFNSIYKHELDIIYSNDNPINEIHFLEPTNNNRLKDGCLVSYYKTQKEMETEHTEYAIKFKLKDLFKEYGLKGKANGVYHYDKKTQRYKQVQYTFIQREVEKPKNVYSDFDNIKFCDYTIESLSQQIASNPRVDYLWNTIQKTSQE